MTLKAIDILTKRSKDRDTGFMLMSEAAVSFVLPAVLMDQCGKALTPCVVDRQGDARPGCRPSAGRPARIG